MRILARTAVYAAALTVFGVTGGIARADLKLEQTVETKGDDPLGLLFGVPPSAGSGKTTRKTVSFYKGMKRRVEDGATIRLFDDAANTLTVLDSRAKTYYVLDLGSKITMPVGTQLPDFSGDADVKDTTETRTVGGKTARHYRYTITMRVTIGGAKSPLATVTTQGDQWATDALNGGDTSAKQSLPSQLAVLPGDMGKGLRPIAEKMATIKGYILEESQSTTLASVLLQDAPKSPYLSNTKTSAISEAPLPDALFAPPADFKKMDPPKAG